jgi:hypothetical protein
MRPAPIPGLMAMPETSFLPEQSLVGISPRGRGAPASHYVHKRARPRGPLPASTKVLIALRRIENAFRPEPSWPYRPSRGTEAPAPHGDPGHLGSGAHRDPRHVEIRATWGSARLGFPPSPRVCGSKPIHCRASTCQVGLRRGARERQAAPYGRGNGAGRRYSRIGRR